MLKILQTDKSSQLLIQTKKLDKIRLGLNRNSDVISHVFINATPCSAAGFGPKRLVLCIQIVCH